MATIDRYLADMLEKQGSVLHLSAGQPARYRIQGALVPAGDQVIDAAGLEAMLREICPAEPGWDAFIRSGDLDFTYSVPNFARFHCSFLSDYAGIGAVVRLLPEEISAPADLGIPDAVQAFCNLSGGLVLFTGCGRNAAAAALIQQINSTQNKQIITIEDPIETVFKNQSSFVIQREIGTHCRSFADALRSAGRADPEVLFVSSLRDPETIRLTLECAAMGMLVFACMDTCGAADSVAALPALCPESERNQIRELLAETLRGCYSRMACCGTDGSIVLAQEVLSFTDALPPLIRENRPAELGPLMEACREYGMISLDGSVLDLLNQGLISGQEAFLKVRDKRVFAESAQPEGEGATPQQ
ncbi:MAG: Flp pilus assembly complex ATPase component TadA [Lentisphaeria bacterium]|nr:Flp pilus assembly complex ATPase component TadA [Lentisphaeria bacterium]